MCFPGVNGILYIFITDPIKDENVLLVSIIQPNYPVNFLTSPKYFNTYLLKITHGLGINLGDQ